MIEEQVPGESGSRQNAPQSQRRASWHRSPRSQSELSQQRPGRRIAVTQVPSPPARQTSPTQRWLRAPQLPSAKQQPLAGRMSHATGQAPSCSTLTPAAFATQALL
jgi:hypothetical protein